MTAFSLKTSVESEMNSAPPVMEGPSYSDSSSCILAMTEATMEAVRDSTLFESIMIDGFVALNEQQYMILQENALTTVFDRVKEFFQKLIVAVKNLMEKAQTFFARILGQTERWYKLIQPRLAAAKKKNPYIKFTMRKYKAQDYMRLSKECAETVGILLALAAEENQKGFIEKILRRPVPVKTPTDTLNRAKDLIAEFAKERTKREGSSDAPKSSKGLGSKDEFNASFEEFIKNLKTAADTFSKMDSQTIEAAAANIISPGTSTIKAAEDMYLVKLYDSDEPVEVEYNYNLIDPYVEVIVKGKSISDKIKQATKMLHVQLNIARQKWFVRQSEFISAFEIKRDMDARNKKSSGSIDRKDLEIKRLIQAGSSYISKYASYICKLFGVLSKAASVRCQTFSKAFSGAQRDGMRLITAYINAAEKPEKA